MPTTLAPHDPELIRHFLTNVRGAIPLSIEQIDTILDLIAAACGDRVDTMLDLGSGDGLIAAAILDEHPGATAVLAELSEPILAAVCRQLRNHTERIEALTADPAHRGWLKRVQQHAPYDVVISSFAIDHLPCSRRRELFGEIHELLRRGGLYLNIENVASTTRWTQSPLDDVMIESLFGESLRAAPRRPRVEIARDFYTRAKIEADVPAPLEVQCDWLREIGFADVECYLKVRELAIFGGVRA